jgi:hypothetical protein
MGSSRQCRTCERPDARPDQSVTTANMCEAWWRSWTRTRPAGRVAPPDARNGARPAGSVAAADVRGARRQSWRYARSGWGAAQADAREAGGSEAVAADEREAGWSAVAAEECEACKLLATKVDSYGCGAECKAVCRRRSVIAPRASSATAFDPTTPPSLPHHGHGHDPLGTEGDNGGG